MTDTPPLLATAGPFQNPPAYVPGLRNFERVIASSRFPGAKQLNVPNHIVALTHPERLDDDLWSSLVVVSPSHLCT